MSEKITVGNLPNDSDETDSGGTCIYVLCRSAENEVFEELEAFSDEDAVERARSKYPAEQWFLYRPIANT